ncbi:MAG TPA: fasciclin domain-containing protein [Solirubrobacterales bacterium]|nr:fasciclin domain-containing protein [Solirubrobacterales bacterium]
MLKRTFLIGACLLALAAGLVACGDDEETTGMSGGATTTEMEGGSAGADNIVMVAAETPDLSTLVDAVTAAGLVKTLEEPGPYTVFAPTNQAFEALGGTLDMLLEPESKAELAEILTYHVVPGELTASELKDGQMLKTVQGDSLEVQIKGEEVTIEGAKVAMADVEASNGVVHVIDSVLLPPKG